MVTDQEPRYRLVDADGNVVGSLFAETDGTLKLQEGTSGNDNEVSLTTQGALEVEQASVTNETFVRAGRGSDVSGNAGDFVSVVDSELKDVRGEFSGTTFTPDETGEYDIMISPLLEGSTAAGDIIEMRAIDVTNNNRQFPLTRELAASPTANPSVYFTTELQAGNDYEFQVRNIDNSFAVKSFDDTLVIVRRSIVE